MVTDILLGKSEVLSLNVVYWCIQKTLNDSLFASSFKFNSLKFAWIDLSTAESAFRFPENYNDEKIVLKIAGIVTYSGKGKEIYIENHESEFDCELLILEEINSNKSFQLSFRFYLREGPNDNMGRFIRYGLPYPYRDDTIAQIRVNELFNNYLKSLFINF